MPFLSHCGAMEHPAALDAAFDLHFSPLVREVNGSELFLKEPTPFYRNESIPLKLSDLNAEIRQPLPNMRGIGSHFRF
jgi:hypothetical protein